jgi:hypothetical protein
VKPRENKGFTKDVLPKTTCRDGAAVAVRETGSGDTDRPVRRDAPGAGNAATQPEGAGGNDVPGHKDVPPGTPTNFRPSMRFASARASAYPHIAFAHAEGIHARIASAPAPGARVRPAAPCGTPHLSKERPMQLFKTEMMFLHPPRTRPTYGTRALRYGRRLPLRPADDDLPRLSEGLLPRDAHASVVAIESTLCVDRAA